MDDVKFRSSFPEFKDPERFTKGSIDLWADFWEDTVNLERWGNRATLGEYLFVAHNLALAAADLKTAKAGGIPGQVGGGISSKSVGAVSVSYDRSNITNPADGIWNLTSYGQRYRDLVRRVGVGCLVV